MIRALWLSQSILQPVYLSSLLRASTSIYHGPFVELIEKLNEYEPWRSIYGAPSKRGKDQELILRFLALYYMADQYTKPLNEFLNTFVQKHRFLKRLNASDVEVLFRNTINVFYMSVGRAAFRSQRVLNAAVFDVMMVGLARRLEKKPIENLEQVKQVHDELIQKKEFFQLYTSGTTDEKNIEMRIEMSTKAFGEVI